MKNKKTYDLVVVSLIMAVIVLLTFTPIGFIQLPLISVTIVHIPVLVGSYLYGKKGGLIFGLAFGLSSMANVLIRGTAMDYTFVYPWVSILPRLIFGFSAGLIFELVKKLKLKKQIAALPIATFIATYVFHTWVVFVPYVITYALLVQNIPIDTSLWILAAGIFAVSGLSESIVAALIVPVIIFAIDKKFREIRIKKSSLVDETNVESDELGYNKMKNEDRK